MLGSFMAHDDATIRNLEQNQEWGMKNQHPGAVATTEVTDVAFGPCRGKKYVYRMTAPAPIMRVDYLLQVPGGFVSIWLGTKSGADFDETAIETTLHTLRVSMPPPPTEEELDARAAEWS